MKRSTRLNVLLDGKPAPRAFYADGRRGVIREYAEDAEGKLIIRNWREPPSAQYPEGEWCGEIVKRERRGKVTWVWLEEK